MAEHQKDMPVAVEPGETSDGPVDTRSGALMGAAFGATIGAMAGPLGAGAGAALAAAIGYMAANGPEVPDMGEHWNKERARLVKNMEEDDF